MEVIVVDNASSDCSREQCPSMFPWVKWIQSDENVGFGPANNLAASQATGKFLLLLNTDAMVETDIATPMAHYLQSHPMTGCVIPQLSSPGGHPADSSGYFIGPLERVRVLARRLTRHNVQHHTVQKVDYVSGAALMVSRDLFLKNGGFDPRFFMYCEDMDLQKRLSDAGYENLVLPYGGVVHLEGGSFQASPQSIARRWKFWLAARRQYSAIHLTPTERFFTRISEIFLLAPVMLLQRLPLKEKIRLLRRFFT